MKIQIKSIGGSILFEGDFSCVAKAVEAAVKSSADLSSADLSYADLSSANLSSANLRYADLSSADLSSADLRYADLSSIKADYFDVLLRGKKEIEGLRAALVEGRVNGSTYEGECACLVGTIANVCHKAYNGMDNLQPNSDRPIERFFLAIKTKDTPETNQVSKLAVEWLDEFTALLNA